MPHRHRLFPLMLAMSTLLSMPLSARGLPTDRGKPVHLHADNISIDQNTGLSHYRGNVVLRQGSLRIDANRATAMHKRQELKSVAAQGSPAVARQLLETAPREIVVRGQTMTYDATTRRVLVAGKVEIERGRDRVYADELSYGLDSRELLANGKNGRQVRATLWRTRETRP